MKLNNENNMKPIAVVTIIIGISICMIVAALLWNMRANKPFTAAPQNSEAHQETDQSARLRVSTSFYTLGEFARQVGGEKVLVSTIVPGGIEPHDYEPSTQDIASLFQSQVVILNGGGLDVWGTELAPELNKQNVDVLTLSDALHIQSEDPHFWLDPVVAQAEIQLILDSFVKADPKNGVYYKERAVAFSKELQKLDESYKKGLSSCQKHTIVTSHAVFGYLSHRYGFQAESIAGFSPESEPSAKQLSRLVRFMRQYDVRYIFFESSASPRLAETLSKETSAATLVFHPLESLTDEDIAQGLGYISIMQNNLNQLRLALECHE